MDLIACPFVRLIIFCLFSPFFCLSVRLSVCNCVWLTVILSLVLSVCSVSCECFTCSHRMSLHFLNRLLNGHGRGIFKRRLAAGAEAPSPSSCMRVLTGPLTNRVEAKLPVADSHGRNGTAARFLNRHCELLHDAN